MSARQNKEIVRYIMEAYNKGNYDEFFKAFAPDSIAYYGKTPFKGLQAFKDLDLGVRKAFPDGRYTIEAIFAEGDMVAWRENFTGTLTGKFLKFEPNGKKVVIPALVVHRFVNGKIIETWAERDTLEMYQQMGIIPTLL